MFAFACDVLAGVQWWFMLRDWLSTLWLRSPLSLSLMSSLFMIMIMLLLLLLLLLLL